MVEMLSLPFDEQLARLAPLDVAEELEACRPDEPLERSLLVTSRELVAPADLAARVEREGEPLVLGHLEPDELATFVPIEAVELPAAPTWRSTSISAPPIATSARRRPFATSSPPAARR